ncbi:YiiX family permuted papain-like enzyme [Mucilaginibacter auburnensis]|uniref:Permuted papain-like amidase YaeF/Yiix C92 family enzyme n=1 Tax=Mucilaginibacter auburnensis TaxID=1457233 RepID=A0A2H9VM69_9SPHI|nr:YiiX family permuted papain-like enzyme [Mucilaginibacter auburnensis]PJJ79403.1 permuted papain-like amidase YaeF/Yiix C92 family enzyme [Mucilaginibacter auburnensis]
MKRLLTLALIALTIGLSSYNVGNPAKSIFLSNNQNADLQSGDIIFQTNSTGLSAAIQLATRSKYSHCGIIFKQNNGFYVLEAVGPVKATPLTEWIAHGDGGKYVVKRLKNAASVLTPDNLVKIKLAEEQLKGKDYDLTFEWNDERIYCSELVWKMYKRGAGIEIGKLEKLKDFDLTSPVVKAKLKEHYGDKVPLNETIISPVAIFNSPLLVTVKSN